MREQENQCKGLTHTTSVCEEKSNLLREKNKPKVRCATHVMRDCFNEANIFLQNRNSSDLNESVDWYLFLEANCQWCEESVGGWRGKIGNIISPNKFLSKSSKIISRSYISDMKKVWGVVGGLAKPLRLALLLLLSGHPLTGITYTYRNIIHLHRGM